MELSVATLFLRELVHVLLLRSHQYVTPPPSAAPAPTALQLDALLLLMQFVNP
jgi:hypothetical protein